MTMLQRIAEDMYAVDWPEMYHADWNDTALDMKQRYMTLAKAALEAMLEPSEAMKRAWSGPCPWDDEALEVWQDLIKAAIAER